MEFDLPAYEDIYDFNESDLNYYKSRIKESFEQRQNLSEKWQRKGQRILELIQVELEERIAVNQITSFCTKELNSELYKEVFSDELSKESTDIRDTEEESKDERKEASVSEKMWNMRKNKKNYKDFVKNTLKNTQQSVGLVIGGSSVPVVKVNKVEAKEIKEKEVKEKEAKEVKGKKTDVKKIPDKKDLKDKGKIQVKTEPLKKNEDGKIEVKGKAQEAKSKPPGKAPQVKLQNEKAKKDVKSNKVAGTEVSLSSSTTLSAVNIVEETLPKVTDRLINEERPSIEKLNSVVSSRLTEDCTENTQKDIEFKVDSSDEAGLKDSSHKAENKKDSSHKAENQIDSYHKTEHKEVENDSPTDQKNDLHTTDCFESKKTEINPVNTEIKTKHFSSITEKKSNFIHSNLHDNESESLEELEDIQICSKDQNIEEKNLDSCLKPDFAAKTPKNLEFKNESKSENKTQAVTAGNLDFDPSNQEETLEEKSDQIDNPPIISGNQIPPTVSPKGYSRKTEPNFDTYQPDMTGLADLKALKQKILASKLNPKPADSKAKPDPVQVVKPQTKAKKASEVFTDYSPYYSSFFEIFAGCNVFKDFSPLIALRECLSTFKEFVSLIDSPEFEVHKKFKLSLAPLEINPRDLVKGEESFPVYPCEKEMYYRVVKARPEVYDIVSRGLNKKKAWTELPHGMNLRLSWNLMWTWSKPSLDFSKLLVWQQVNHFPETKNFSRKDMLKKNIEKIMKISTKAGTLWNIIPVTYVLPKEYVTFVDHYGVLEESEPDRNVWIMKPVGKSRGRGISVINDINQVSYGEIMVIQRYISNPLLLEGFKFDLRLYILITKFLPLETFIYKEGFARMSTVPFSMNPDKLHNKFIHLTNASIQKYNYHKEENLDSILGGTKICLKTLKERLHKLGINWDKIWAQIIEVVLKSLIAVQSDIPSYSCCFDLVGYDIMIDQNLQTWLVEINSSPSLARENYLDDLIKQQLIDDTLELVNPMYFNKQELVRILERRVSEVQKGRIDNTVAQLNQDLHKVLDGKKPRKYGEMPEKIGNFEMISPSPLYEKLYKIANPRS